MATFLRLAVVAALIVGTAFSCNRRHKEKLLVKVAQRFVQNRYRNYADSSDTMTSLSCKVQKMSEDERKAVRSRIPWLGAYPPFSGTCDLAFTFRDYPKQGENSRVRVQLYYAWAGENRDWELVERRLLD